MAIAVSTFLVAGPRRRVRVVEPRERRRRRRRRRGRERGRRGRGCLRRPDLRQRRLGRVRGPGAVRRRAERDADHHGPRRSDDADRDLSSDAQRQSRRRRVDRRPRRSRVDRRGARASGRPVPHRRDGWPRERRRGLRRPDAAAPRLHPGHGDPERIEHDGARRRPAGGHDRRPARQRRRRARNWRRRRGARGARDRHAHADGAPEPDERRLDAETCLSLSVRQDRIPARPARAAHPVDVDDGRRRRNPDFAQDDERLLLLYGHLRAARDPDDDGRLLHPDADPAGRLDLGDGHGGRDDADDDARPAHAQPRRREGRRGLRADQRDVDDRSGAPRGHGLLQLVRHAAHQELERHRRQREPVRRRRPRDRQGRHGPHVVVAGTASTLSAAAAPGAACATSSRPTGAP